MSRLEALATQAGARLGMLRVMEATHLQAATDPLTGLLNRRSFENKVQDLLRRREPFTLAMGDLDHFKVLNDTHGHDAGDRALRLFSRTMREAVRTGDLVSRYGGEEFVIAFPGLSVEAAARALGRIQEQLVLALSGGRRAAVHRQLRGRARHATATPSRTCAGSPTRPCSGPSGKAATGSSSTTVRRSTPAQRTRPSADVSAVQPTSRRRNDLHARAQPRRRMITVP